MDSTDIKQYFEEYIKPYTPYSDGKVYDALMDYLSNSYLDTIYNDIPTIFKELYENNQIVSDVYDQLLTAIGVNDEVIQSLTTTEKGLFLTSLSDFIRYKGTVSMFQKVGDTFSDDFDIYELFADYDSSEQAWVLKPYSIYKGSKYPTTLETIFYDDVYNSVPNLLVSSDQLNSIKNDLNAMFPLKTNLLLLDYNLYSQVNPMMNLVICTLLKDFGDTPIDVYMQDEMFNVTFKQLYFIWYYVISLFYENNWHRFDTREVIQYSENLNPYSLSDLPSIFERYNKLDNSADVGKFYDEIFDNYFRTIFRANAVDLDSMKSTFESINKDFCTYIHTRLAEAETESDRSREFTSITNEIYNSFLLLLYQYRDVEYFNEYFTDYFLLSLPHLVVDPKDTTTYIILYNFKPFHVEFITRHRETIVSDDKFNIALPGSEEQFVMELYKLDYIAEIADNTNFAITIFKTSNITTESVLKTHYFYHQNPPDEIKLGFDSRVDPAPRVVDTEDIVDKKDYLLSMYKKHSIDLISIIKQILVLTYNEPESGILVKLEELLNFYYLPTDTLDLVSILSWVAVGMPLYEPVDIWDDNRVFSGVYFTLDSNITDTFNIISGFPI